MARTIKQIKKSMTDEFMASDVIRKKYGFGENDTFENSFSLVSIESIIFGVIASAVYVLESLFEIFKKDVDRKISSAVLASIPWYHKIALQYQHGDELVFDDNTMQYGYETVSPDKQLVKFAACRDNRGYVYVLAAGEDSTGRPVHLSNDVLTPFKKYMNDLKPAGIPLVIVSYDPDVIQFSVRVQYNPLLLNSDGSMVSDFSSHPVEDAITEYLYDIEYGGVFNKTKLVDAIQQVMGVTDVILDDVKVKSASSAEYSQVTGNNYTSAGGAFVPSDLRNSISYVLQL